MKKILLVNENLQKNLQMSGQPLLREYGRNFLKWLLSQKIRSYLWTNKVDISVEHAEGPILGRFTAQFFQKSHLCQCN